MPQSEFFEYYFDLKYVYSNIIYNFIEIKLLLNQKFKLHEKNYRPCHLGNYVKCLCR